MTGPIILSTHPLHASAGALLEKRRDLGASLRIAPALDDASLVAAALEASVIIVRANLPPALFAQAPKLKAAIRHGAGLDMIPMQDATRAGVLAANVPGANARTVAEHVIMVALMLLRRFRSIDGALRKGIWQPARDIAETSGELSGKTLGIVGFGAIGAALSTMAMHGFGMRVLAYRRSDAPMPDGVERSNLDDLLMTADIIVLACPLTDETRGLINASRFAQMRPEALLINIARGAVVDEAALVAALNRKQIAGAALDVFASQPLAEDHPLRLMENVVLTPHIAGIAEASMARIAMSAMAQAIAVLDGELPVHLVNPEALPAYRKRWA